MPTFTTVPLVEVLAPQIKDRPKKTYCPKCGAYARVVEKQCKYCRDRCKGSRQYPPVGTVIDGYGICDFCSKRVKLDNEFGRMRLHTEGK